MNASDIQNNQPLAVCLHASASSKGQWNSLRKLLDGRVRTITPDLVGYGEAGTYKKNGRFGFTQEVDNVVRQIQSQTGKVGGPLHLIGHSYGAATALQFALAYPERVASLTLYEPAQFLLLFANGLSSPEAQEILQISRYVNENVTSPIGRWFAAKRFIEYWSGEGIWARLPLKRKRRFARLMPKVVAEFDAILSAKVVAEDFAALGIPVRLICGTETRATARKVISVLSSVLPNVEEVVIEGADHMGPTTMARVIDPIFAEHVFARLVPSYEIAA